MQPNKLKIRPLLLSFLILLLAGCTSIGLKDETEIIRNQQLEQAKLATAEGDFARAAELFERLALESAPPQRFELLLRAAESYLQGGEDSKAEEMLKMIQLGVPSELRFHRRIVMAELALLRNRPDKVAELLTAPAPENTSAELRKRYYSTKAEGFRLSGNLVQSAQALSELDLLNAGSEQRVENQLAIIQTLITLTDNALSSLQPEPPGIMGGWMELARIVKAHANEPSSLFEQVEQWREQYPGHPAMPMLMREHFQKMEEIFIRPSQLAVLLPTKGPRTEAAAALRDGMLAAYYQQAVENRPKILFFDNSDTANTWPLYREALDTGADIVIGPLSKSAVGQFTRAGELETPVLALNQVPPEVTPPNNLFQYGLSPEDEARQAAERAWLDGHTTAVAFIPQSNWGERILHAFRDRFEKLGGTLAEYQAYDTKVHDFSQPISALLNLDESSSRHQALQSLLGRKLEFKPSRRQDADFLFLVAKSQLARQIRPQFLFHHAADLPVYTTSHIHTHASLPGDAQDLEGLMFPDIPWLLVDDEQASLSRRQLAAILPESQGRYRRLYAMGIDSYNLLPHLARLRSNPAESLDGKTGILYLNGINQFHRQLVWAQMQNGLPHVIGYAPRIDTNPGSIQELERQPQMPSDVDAVAE